MENNNFPNKLTLRFTPGQVILMKVIGIFLLFSIFILGLAYNQKVKRTRSQATDSGPTLSIVPENKLLKVGEMFSFNIILATGTDTVSAADVKMSYNPQAVEILSFTPGEILPVVLVPSKVEGAVLRFTLGVAPDRPYKGSGVLGTLEIKAKSLTPSTLASTLEFAPSTAVSSLGKNDNTLAKTVPAHISLVDSSGTEPSVPLLPSLTAGSYVTVTATPSVDIPIISPTPTNKPSATPKPFLTPVPSTTPTSEPTITITIVPSVTVEPTFEPSPTSVPSPTSTIIVEEYSQLSPNPTQALLSVTPTPSSQEQTVEKQMEKKAVFNLGNFFKNIWEAILGIFVKK